MDDPQKKIMEIFKDADEIILKDISIDADQIGFEVRSGRGGIPPQIPIRIQYNNQTFSGIVLQNVSTSKKHREV